MILPLKFPRFSPPTFSEDEGNDENGRVTGSNPPPHESAGFGCEEKMEIMETAPQGH